MSPWQVGASRASREQEERGGRMSSAVVSQGVRSECECENNSISAFAKVTTEEFYPIVATQCCPKRIFRHLVGHNPPSQCSRKRTLSVTSGRSPWAVSKGQSLTPIGGCLGVSSTVEGPMSSSVETSRTVFTLPVYLDLDASTNA